MSWKTPLRGALIGLLDRLSTEQLRDFLLEILSRRARRGDAAAGLRLLFDIEDELRREQDRLAIALEGGLHPKHRLTRYHDFFVRRVRNGERVLDIGCGCGALARDLAERAQARVLGLDLDPGNIARAQAEFAHPLIRYAIADATTELPGGQFDVVVLSNVLEHIEERTALLARALVSCRPRVFLIRVPLLEREWRVALRRELGARWKLDSTHAVEYTPESLAAELRRSGLEPVHQECRWGEIWVEAAGGRPARDGTPGSREPQHFAGTSSCRG